jgi:hypothetical protein
MRLLENVAENFQARKTSVLNVCTKGHRIVTTATVKENGSSDFEGT